MVLRLINRNKTLVRLTNNANGDLISKLGLLGIRAEKVSSRYTTYHFEYNINDTNIFLQFLANNM